LLLKVQLVEDAQAAHPDPVVFLHGLGANYQEDINFLQADVAAHGYCTFATTYGAWPGFPFVGGLRPIPDSAAEIKAFVGQVLAETGANKVDIVGHSEGAFQSLYVTKTQGVASHVGKVVAIAPPTHGTTFGGLYNLAYIFGQAERAQVGDRLLGGSAHARDQFDLAGVHLGRNFPARELGQRLEHIRAGVPLPADGGHQEQLLLDTSRECVGGAEGGGVELWLRH